MNACCHSHPQFSQHSIPELDRALSSSWATFYQLVARHKEETLSCAIIALTKSGNFVAVWQVFLAEFRTGVFPSRREPAANKREQRQLMFINAVVSCTSSREQRGWLCAICRDRAQLMMNTPAFRSCLDPSHTLHACLSSCLNFV